MVTTRTMRPRWVLAVLAVLVVLVVAGVGVLRVRVASEWDAMIRKADELQESLERADWTRPVLWGAAQEGLAWEEYGRAIESAHRVRRAPERLRRIRRGQLRPDALGELMRDLEPALAALRRGAHRCNARYPIDWDKGWGDRIPSLMHARALVNVAVSRCDGLVDDGEPGRAVELLLDAMQFGADMMMAPRLMDEMIGCALFAIASLEAVERYRLLERLPEAELRSLNSALAKLDGRTTRQSRSLEGETVIFVRGLLRDPDMDLDAIQDVEWRKLRFGFSGRWALADYVAVSATHARAVRSFLRPSNRDDARAWLAARQRELEQSVNPLVQAFMPNMAAAAGTRLGTIARLRLLRMAVAARLGDELRALDEPFGGGTLRIERRGDDLVLDCPGLRKNREVVLATPSR